MQEKILLFKLQVEQDPEAFAALYDLYVKRIYRFVYFKVSSHEEAEDITSEVFLKAWHYLQEKKEVKSFSGLLYRVARNCIIDLYRSKAAKPETVVTDFSEKVPEIGDGGGWYADISGKMETQKIIEVLRKLKQEYREVITLRYIDELEINEIAEIVDRSTMAVRVTLHRAVKKLRELMAEK
ncbi:MAG: RNA polymerase sigma factor [Candidatus Magasanikbacteria bacterium]|nr:RNA polymerase sigma factor [Candidatus Magasanikbacteria bacterium]